MLPRQKSRHISTSLYFLTSEQYVPLFFWKHFRLFGEPSSWPTKSTPAMSLHTLICARIDAAEFRLYGLHVVSPDTHSELLVYPELLNLHAHHRSDSL